LTLKRTLRRLLGERPAQTGGLEVRSPAGDAFAERFAANLATCTWEPHQHYSLLAQWDGDLYRERWDEFLHKYRCFNSLTRTLAPERMIELGVCMGAGADAYLSGARSARYLGLDTFGEPFSDGDGSPWRSLSVGPDGLWKPRDMAAALLRDRGFPDWDLMTVNFRHLSALPEKADLVVVDGAHDFENQYADLVLALTAEPAYVFVDDFVEAEPAVRRFFDDDVAGRVEFAVVIDYVGQGMLIKLR
jgi:hypothetical protein